LSNEKIMTTLATRIRRRFAALAAILLLTGCAAQTGSVTGRVKADDAPVEGVRVTLTATSPATAATLTAITDADGNYIFPKVEPGDFELGARLDGEPALVSARRATPLHLSPGGTKHTGLKLVEWEGVIYSRDSEEPEGFGSISGRVLHRNAPVSGATITLYLDLEEGLKGPGYRQSFVTDEEGQFFLGEVSEGRYYAVARQRATGAAGPVREGDLYGEATAAPLLVRSKMEASINIHVVKKEKAQAPHATALDATSTAIVGRIVDAAGNPVSGVYVFAYRDRTIGHRMPDFLTPPTDADGVFVLPLGEGGLFYVGAREFFGGSPQPGERFGLYEGSADHGIRVREGEKVSDIVIRVNEVLPQ
jgi:hypothetical protein